MELSDLHVFRTVVEAGGITRAAEKLNRVQSNVTTRIQQLEEQLGVALFIREGKRLHLSPAGKVMLGYAERLLDLAREARESVHDAKPRGLLRFAAPESTASVRLPTPLSEYCRRYPEVTLELRTGNGEQVASDVLTGDDRCRHRGRADSGCAVRKAADLQRGAGADRRRRTSADPLGARRAARRPSWCSSRAARGASGSSSGSRCTGDTAGTHDRDHLLPRHARLRGRRHGHLAGAAHGARHLPRACTG